jgi:hypothetical protein
LDTSPSPCPYSPCLLPEWRLARGRDVDPWLAGYPDGPQPTYYASSSSHYRKRVDLYRVRLPSLGHGYGYHSHCVGLPAISTPTTVLEAPCRSLNTWRDRDGWLTHQPRPAHSTDQSPTWSVRRAGFSGRPPPPGSLSGGAPNYGPTPRLPCSCPRPTPTSTPATTISPRLQLRGRTGAPKIGGFPKSHAPARDVTYLASRTELGNRRVNYLHC